MALISSHNSVLAGARYFFEGVRLILRPELRKYILIPLLINCLLFFSLTALFVTFFEDLAGWNLHLPQWLEFLEKTLKYITYVLIAIILVIAYGYSFNVITNIFAAPFYGLLAQKTEELLTGVKLDDEPLIKMIPRTLWREVHKLFYFLGRGILVFLLIVLLGTIVFLAPLAPVVGAAWGAWSMSIQYVDYPADNHQTPFRRLRKKLRRQFYSSIGFGGAVLGCSMIPLINIIAMPAAVTGGTAFWVRELKYQQALERK